MILPPTLQPYIEHFAASKDKLVYLTADSSNELQEVRRRGKSYRLVGSRACCARLVHALGCSPVCGLRHSPGCLFLCHPQPASSSLPRSLPAFASFSTFVLSQLDSEAIYVVGGIVDRNRHKLLCYNKAEEQVGLAGGRVSL